MFQRTSRTLENCIMIELFNPVSTSIMANWLLTTFLDAKDPDMFSFQTLKDLSFLDLHHTIVNLPR